MALSDYAHHNEEAERIWWQEEGQWAGEPNQYEDDSFDDDYERYEDDDCMELETE